jgi:hypothetical protein
MIDRLSISKPSYTFRLKMVPRDLAEKPLKDLAQNVLKDLAEKSLYISNQKGSGYHHSAAAVFFHSTDPSSLCSRVIPY